MRYVALEMWDGRLRSHPVSCRQCLPCRRAWSGMVAARILEGIEYHQPLRGQYVTITCEEDICDREFSERFRSWRTNLLSRQDTPWFRVFEWQKRGVLHAHLLILGDLFPLYRGAYHRERLSHWWSQLSPEADAFVDQLMRYRLGPLSEVVPVENWRYSGRYLAKYLSKDAGQGRVRKFGASRGWAPRHVPPPLVVTAGRFSGCAIPGYPVALPERHGVIYQAHIEDQARQRWLALAQDLEPIRYTVLSLLDAIQCPPEVSVTCECGCGNIRMVVDDRADVQRDKARDTLADLMIQRVGWTPTLRVLRYAMEAGCH